jgi:hypothetical protein
MDADERRLGKAEVDVLKLRPARAGGFWFLVSGFWFLVSGFWLGFLPGALGQRSLPIEDKNEDEKE